MVVYLIHFPVIDTCRHDGTVNASLKEKCTAGWDYMSENFFLLRIKHVVLIVFQVFLTDLSVYLFCCLLCL